MMEEASLNITQKELNIETSEDLDYHFDLKKIQAWVNGNNFKRVFTFFITFAVI